MNDLPSAEKDRPDLLAIAAENVVALSAECARLRAQIEAVARFLDAARGQKVGADFVIGRIDTILAARVLPPGGDPEKDTPRRRDCPKCGGYQFLSTGGVWRHWPTGPDWNVPPPVECPTLPGGSGQ